MDRVLASFQFRYPRLPKNGLCIMEDLHTAYREEYGKGAHKLTSSQNLGHLKTRDFRRNYPQKGVRHEAHKVYRGANRFCTAPS